MLKLKSIIASSTFNITGYTTGLYKNDNTLPAHLCGSQFRFQAFIPIAGIITIIRMLLVTGVKCRSRCGPQPV